MNKSDWVKPLSHHLNDEVVEWQKDLTKLSTKQVPRCVQALEETEDVTYYTLNDTR